MWIGKKKFEKLLRSAGVDPTLVSRTEASLKVAEERGFYKEHYAEVHNEGKKAGYDFLLWYINWHEPRKEKAGETLTVQDIKNWLTEQLVGNKQEKK